MYIYMHIQTCIYIFTTRVCAPVQRCSRFLTMEAIANLSESCANIVCRLSFPPALLPLRRAGRPPAGPKPDMFA